LQVQQVRAPGRETSSVHRKRVHGVSMERIVSERRVVALTDTKPFVHDTYDDVETIVRQVCPFRPSIS